MDGIKEECVGERRVCGTREERGGWVCGRREEREKGAWNKGNLMYAVHLWSFTCTSGAYLEDV
jgi:hypothetical protein